MKRMLLFFLLLCSPALADNIGGGVFVNGKLSGVDAIEVNITGDGSYDYLGDAPLSISNSVTPGANEIPTTIYSLMTVDASAVPVAGHSINALIWSDDTTTNKQHVYAVEGRIDGASATAGIVYTTILGKARWQDIDPADGTTFAGTVVGLQGSPEIYNYDGVTPRYQGTALSDWVLNPIGGSAAYGILVSDITDATRVVDVGIAIEGADTYALQIGSGADNTDAANGITFGSSGDTNIYRSAANTLKTDDAFVASSISLDGKESIAIDVVRHTITADDVSNGYFFESWNEADADDVIELDMVIYDAGQTAESNGLCVIVDASSLIVCYPSGDFGEGKVATAVIKYLK